MEEWNVEVISVTQADPAIPTPLLHPVQSQTSSQIKPPPSLLRYEEKNWGNKQQGKRKQEYWLYIDHGTFKFSFEKVSRENPPTRKKLAKMGRFIL